MNVGVSQTGVFFSAVFAHVVVMFPHLSPTTVHVPGFSRKCTGDLTLDLVHWLMMTLAVGRELYISTAWRRSVTCHGNTLCPRQLLTKLGSDVPAIAALMFSMHSFSMSLCMVSDDTNVAVGQAAHSCLLRSRCSMRCDHDALVFAHPGGHLRLMLKNVQSDSP